MYAHIRIPLFFAGMISLTCLQLDAADVVPYSEIAKAADAMRPQLVARRRDFHIHPELSNREERTSRIVADTLRSLGFTEIKTNVARHGVVALLRGGRPGPVVAVRADMDALPIQETIDVPYKSIVPNVKHACGHDAHTSILLGVAEILSKNRARLPGSVKFIFQPAEEGAPTGEVGGASIMVKEGALENPRPAAIFGLHVWPPANVGKVFYGPGPYMASSDRFIIKIHGKMAHGGAFPHRGIDAIVVAAESIQALQTIRSRKVDVLEPFVLTVGKIEGGTRNNIVADLVTMDGTLRTLNEDLRAKVPVMIRDILGGVTAAHGATYELELVDGNPVTYNDPALVSDALPSLERVAGVDNVVLSKPTMGAEDFAYYQKVIPGFFFFLGVANPEKKITALVHTAEFDLDEDALPLGVKLLTTSLWDYLEKHPAAK